MSSRQTTKLQFATLAAMVICVWPAFGDGGVVRLRAVSGHFLVTVFVAPESPRAGLVDISVLMQSKDSRETILDAKVDLLLISPPGAQIDAREMFCTPNGVEIRAVGMGQSAPHLPATREQATNKLLYAAKVNLPVDGDWQIRVRLRRGSEMAYVNLSLPVVRAGDGFAGVWPFLTIPCLLITVFAGHQHLKHQVHLEQSHQVESGIAVP